MQDNNTAKEIEEILAGRDLWMEVEEVAERMNKQPPVPNRAAEEDAPKRVSYTAVCVPKRIGGNQKVY